MWVCLLAECLGQQKIQLDQQLQELTAARDAALHDVTRLQQEMTQAEETHSAAQQRLQEEHAAAIKDQQEQLTSQHQQTVQQRKGLGVFFVLPEATAYGFGGVFCPL